MTSTTSPAPRPLARAETLQALGTRPLDLLVVGGGATGCGLARDAALRGLTVALVEREDIASGTSSRSSRLVHGGVRYLEQGALGLVFEASAERRRLLRLAPHLVWPLEFTWPVYAGARVQSWKLAAGLALYDLLALFRNVGTHKRLSAREVLAREPRLRAESLRGGASYWDAATDDARLTLMTAVDAARAGALVATHARVEALRHERGRVAGAVVVDALGGAPIEARARVVVNAAGPWSDAVRALDPSESGRGAAVRGSKGAHIAVPRERVGNVRALTLVVPQDGRVFFVLPAGGFAIIGTTDTDTTAAPEEIRATRADVAYLLGAANAYFPEARLAPEDVVSAWAGVRPLAARPTDAAGAPSAASREHAIVRGPGGLISVTGGKLTTYRSMAAELADVVERALGRRPRRSPTADRPLPGGAI
ncbi:MAG TPA: glycerol-3-phosphate dehydrogenase/oxidase, partial [Gemmatimonadaceae bacterium]|nr:glycerol-3-phosphate dehydrogenase/oxidase [Gemmatimonadaceae bacterium]